MKFTKLKSTFDKEIMLNTGILLTEFTPSTGAIELTNILGATSGGVTFSDTPSFIDLGDDVDNCPKNLKDLKKLDGREVKLSGTFATITEDLAKKLIATTTEAGLDSAIKVKNEIDTTCFTDIWWVGDYTGSAGGFLAIHLKNALSTGGFMLKSTDKDKGKFDFEFTAHCTVSDSEAAPYELYIGTASA